MIKMVLAFALILGAVVGGFAFFKDMYTNASDEQIERFTNGVSYFSICLLITAFIVSSIVFIS